MMGTSPGSRAVVGWDGMGRDRTVETMSCLPHGCRVIQIKLFPTQHGSDYFLGSRWRVGGGGRVPEMYAGPTTSCQHWAELGGHGPSAGLLTRTAPSPPQGCGTRPETTMSHGDQPPAQLVGGEGPTQPGKGGKVTNGQFGG